MSGIIKYTPAVFAAGEHYHITVICTCCAVVGVTVGNTTYYDDSCGILRCQSRVHKVLVPVAELDNAKQYTVVCRQVKVRRQEATELFASQEATFAFNPVPQDDIKIYQVADAHQKPLLPKRAGGYFGNSLNLLVLNGDTFDFLNTDDDFDYMFDMIDEITHGTVPVIFAKGNHDNRGINAEKLQDYTPVVDGKAYYTVHLGGLYALVLDTGENCVDEAPEYGGIIKHHAYREAETQWLKTTGTRTGSNGEDAVYRLVITHSAITNVRCKPFDIETDIYKQWIELIKKNIKPQLMLSGHLHILALSMPGSSFDTLGQPCPVIIGSCPVGWQTGKLTSYIGTALTLNNGTATVRFTNEKHETEEEHILTL